MLAEGDWNAVQKYRKFKNYDFNKMRANDGHILSAHERAEALADHLEQVQWAVRPDTIPSQKPALFTFEDMPCDEFTDTELQTAPKASKKRKSSGGDDVPAEFWQTCLHNEAGCPGRLFNWLRDFCCKMWHDRAMPNSWHRAQVACLFKKGDPACPDNYRPISLVQVGYKLFSSMILRRLKAAGVENKLWKSQFGFRSGHGTSDAIFVARRMMERCHNSKDQSMILLALDWAKAFDSIDPASLIQALRRFGLPQHYLDMIANIYTNREFVVVDHGNKSQTHRQLFGISQGCPLSPFLFVMVMTILLHDARDLMREMHHIDLSEIACSDLVYADDTLLVGVSPNHLQKYMECIAQIGSEYGLKLNWRKVEQMNVNCQNMPIHAPTGEEIIVKSRMKYLGAELAADGHIESELAQKLGVAAREFKCLRRIWNHCNISVKFKLTVFTSCVIQKLLYNLETAWLNKNALRKLDGFYAKCLRQILKISPSFISRVSNHYVLQQFNVPPLSKTLLQRQLLLFGRIARMPNESVVRDSIFEQNGVAIKTDSRRRQGRPRNTWSHEVTKVAHQISHDTNLHSLVTNKLSWQQVVKAHCSVQNLDV